MVSRLSLLLVLLAVGVGAAHAQSPRLQPPASWHVLRAAEYEAGTRVPATRLAASKTRSATINVSYIGFSTEARAAFQRAVDIWERHIESPIVINIDAFFEPLDEGVLGAAGPTLVVADEPELPLDDTWYPIALGEALIGQDLEPGEADIIAQFNSDFDNWYFGLDGNTPRGTFDFVTVVLHEIGHGLGFTGSFSFDDGEAPAECTGTFGVGCWGLGSAPLPFAYDRFVEDGSDTSLLNTSAYPNPSAVLGDALQSENLFFDGPTTTVTNEGIPVDLYAPANFEPGSSFSHFDESLFPPGNENSLMTPQLARSESVQSPGPLLCAVFQDLGWPLGPECLALTDIDLVEFDAMRAGEGVRVVWEVVPEVGFAQFVVEQSYFDGPYEDVATRMAEGESFAVVLEDLEPGTYNFRLRQVFADGQVVTSQPVEVVLPLQEAFRLSEPFPNPFSTTVRANLLVREGQDVTVSVYDLLGRRVAVLFEGRALREDLIRIAWTPTSASAGVYAIVAEGSTFRATDTVVLVR